MSFITDNSPLPFPKTDRETLPENANPAQHLTASEWNVVCQDIIDIRAWFISGTYYGLVSQSSQPNTQMGLSGTVGAIWLSSSLHPYVSVTSSNGTVTRKIALAPTGTNIWTGLWQQVLVDEQGIVISGSLDGGGGGGGGYETIASGSNVSLPQQTKIWFLPGGFNVIDDTVNSATAVAHASSSLSAGSIDSPTSITTDAYGHITAATAGGSPTYANVNATNVTSSSGLKTVDLEATRNSTLVTVSATTLTASSGIKALDLESTRNSTLVTVSATTLTASSGIKALDLEATRNATLVTVSATTLTASSGIKALDLEATRNINGVNLTASAGIKTNLDLEATRNLTVGALASFVNLTASAGIKTNLDLEVTRNLTIGGSLSLSSLTASSGIKALDLEATRNTTVAGKIFVTDDISGSFGMNLVRGVMIGSPTAAGAAATYGLWTQAKHIGAAGASVFVGPSTFGSSYFAITNTTANQGYIGTGATSVPLHLCVGLNTLDHLVLKGDTNKSVGIGLTNSNIRARLHVSGSASGLNTLMIEGSASFATGSFNIAGGMTLSLGDSNSSVGFFGATPQTKADIAGSRGGNAALANLLSALQDYGLITDSTTA